MKKDMIVWDYWDDIKKKKMYSVYEKIIDKESKLFLNETSYDTDKKL